MRMRNVDRVRLHLKSLRREFCEYWVEYWFVRWLVVSIVLWFGVYVLLAVFPEGPVTRPAVYAASGFLVGYPVVQVVWWLWRVEEVVPGELDEWRDTLDDSEIEVFGRE